jgi:hypothetical protein
MTWATPCMTSPAPWTAVSFLLILPCFPCPPCRRPVLPRFWAPRSLLAPRKPKRGWSSEIGPAITGLILSSPTSTPYPETNFTTTHPPMAETQRESFLFFARALHGCSFFLHL